MLDMMLYRQMVQIYTWAANHTHFLPPLPLAASEAYRQGGRAQWVSRGPGGEGSGGDEEAAVWKWGMPQKMFHHSSQ